MSADPLSPERGSYQFAQQMLRQVAYDTLSRRDRKARHLKVAAHLRAAFPGDGEEVADVIARHYLDALDAVPDDRDAGQIRGQAITALIRAAERAERTGAPAQAAASYATAAELTLPDTADVQPAAGMLWERAAHAAVTSADWAAAVEHAGRARDYHLQRGQTRAAARAQAIAGQALRSVGPSRRRARAAHRGSGGPARGSRHRHGPRPGAARGTGGVRRLGRGRQAVYRGAHSRPGARRGRQHAQRPVSSPAASTSTSLGAAAPRRPPTSAKPRGSPHRPTTTSPWDAHSPTCRTTLAVTDSGGRGGRGTHRRRAPAPGRRPGLPVVRDRQPGPGAAAARRLGRRRGGSSPGPATPTGWPTASTSPGTEAGWRRCAATPSPPRPCWRDCGTCRPAKTPRTRPKSASWKPSPPTPAASHRTRCATPAPPSRTQEPSGSATSSCGGRGRWPPAPPTTCVIPRRRRAARPARLLPARASWVHAAGRTRPGPRPPGRQQRRPPALRPSPPPISGLRELSTPYHLAHGLLDHAQHLARLHEADAAEAAIGEARDIARRLRCQPLLDRAANITSVQSPVQT